MLVSKVILHTNPLIHKRSQAFPKCVARLKSPRQLWRHLYETYAKREQINTAGCMCIKFSPFQSQTNHLKTIKQTYTQRYQACKSSHTKTHYSISTITKTLALQINSSTSVAPLYDLFTSPLEIMQFTIA
jgi:hypothetical protein